MIDEGPPDEIVELEENRWILLVYSRRWPIYVIDWSIRQRVGDSDFPTQRGQVEAPPSRENGEEIWASLRQSALDEAMVIAETASPEPKSRSLVSRLFGR